jgi:hypothetical protein
MADSFSKKKTSRKNNKIERKSPGPRRPSKKQQGKDLEDMFMLWTNSDADSTHRKTEK